MKISDILRQVAEKLDGLNDRGDLLNTEPSDPPEDPIMMTPLQQKLELLKKGVGVESAFDTDSREPKDEIATMRKNAGMSPAMLHKASDDTDVD